MKKNIIFFLVILISYACHKDIPIYNENNFEPLLVLHSLSAPDSTLRVFLTKSTIPEQLDTNIFIKNAEVALYEDGNFIENLKFVEKRVYDATLAEDDYTQYKLYEFYKSDYILKDNHKYTIVAKALNKEVSADIVFPDKNFSVDFSLTDNVCDTSQLPNSFYDFYGEGKVSIKITASEKKYYMLRIYSDSWGINYSKNDTIEYLFYPDSAYSRKIMEYTFPQYSSSDNTLDNNLYVQYPYFSFNNDYGRGGFIYSNQLSDNNEFSIGGKLDYAGTQKDNKEIYIKYQVFELSQEMIDYYISSSKYWDADDNPFVEPVNIYSNVKNGFGFVSGYNVFEDSVKIEITNTKL